jgi:nitrogenase molybdenum-iron protein alpha/beta subunit
MCYERREVEERERGARFAESVSLPVIADLPCSDAFARAESAHMTLAEYDPQSREAGIFRKLAEDVARGLSRYEASPLTDEALEMAVLGTVRQISDVPLFESSNDGISTVETGRQLPEARDIIDFTNPNRYLSKNVIHGEPLHGCAFNGALTMASQVQDAVVLAHAPKSCAYISYQTMSSTGRRLLFERGALLPSSIMPNLESTDMGEPEMIFGGMEKLTEKVSELKKRGAKAIVVVSACPSGIIGDDIDSIRSTAGAETPVFTLRTDGNMSGDYLQGMLMCYTSLAEQIIRRDVPQAKDTVNIVFEKVISKNTRANFLTMERYLNSLGVKVNCRFLCETDYESLVNFNTARLNLLAHRDYTGKLLEDFFIREYGSEFFDMAFPVGFAETEGWLRGVAGFFGRQSSADSVIKENRARYMREMEILRQSMRGKRLMVLTYNHDLDWIIGAAIDAGIKIVKIGVFDYSQDEGFRSRLGINLPIEEKYNADNRKGDIAKYKPDILLTNYTFSAAGEVPLADTIPMSPDVGFFTGLSMVKRWSGLLAMNMKGEWIDDERLFRKYCS